MIKKLLTALIILFCLIAAISFAGDNYYANIGGAGTNAGTFANPFTSMATVNANAFATGDDLYFKTGMDYTLTDAAYYLLIDWSGSSGDHVIIGAYYGDGQFGLNGEARPILNGNESYPADFTGMINATTNIDYIDVKNIEIKNSGGHGIQFAGAGTTNITIDNCITDWTYRQGLSFARVVTGSITNNIVSYANRGNIALSQSGGVGIQVTAMFAGTAGGSSITISGNTVHDCVEGIGLYKEANNNIVEKNIVYNNRSYNLYGGSGSYENTFRYNLVYYSSNWTPQGDDGERAISLGCEGWACDGFITNSKCADDNRIYGNFIARAAVGIALTAGAALCTSAGLIPSGNLIYHNTIVDVVTDSFLFNNIGVGTEIKNNISWNIASGNNGDHVSSCSPANVTFDYNLWNDDPGTGNCDAANDPVDGVASLAKTSGWDSITAGTLTQDNFKLSDTSSAAYDVGSTLGSPYNSDYWSTARPQGVAYDIGAHEYEGITAPPVDYGRKIIHRGKLK